MLAKVYETVGTEVTKGWLSSAATPVVAFLALGLGCWASDVGWSSSGERLLDWVDGLGSGDQALVFASSLIALGTLAAIGERMAFPVVRLLEGYWPSSVAWVLIPQRWRVTRRVRAWDKRLQELWRSNERTAREERELGEIEMKRRTYPVDPELLRPTRLGNILRSAESKSTEKYGIDAIIAWPRLWLLLPKEIKSDIASARAALDDGAIRWFWGAALIVWTPLAWWAAPLAVAATTIAYWWMLPSASVFGGLVESAFDTHRWDLYRALRLTAPMSADQERKCGHDLTNFLWRGDDSPTTVFRDADGRGAV